VGQLNEILADQSLWNPAAKAKAASIYEKQIVAAFYDYVESDDRDAWTERERVLPLPGAEQGYAKAQLVGTTGAGKTTILRQLIGTNPKTERFPSTSAAKTTISDLEVVLDEGTFRAVVSFVPRDQVRQCIIECVIAAVAGHLEGSTPSEIARRFMEHSEMRFRLSYILGSLKPPKRSDEEELSDDEDEDADATEDAEVTEEEQREFALRLEHFLDEIERLAAEARRRAARELDFDETRASQQDRDALQELVEEQLMQKDDFHSLVDEILDDVQARFDFIRAGSLVSSRDGWPSTWTHETDDRKGFLQAVNRFSSNYAPNFGRLLTPLVEGIRVAGPFEPDWGPGGIPKLVLLDGQGIGHTADSASSISTGITRRFQLADVIVLVDNAAQPMQAAPVAVLRTLAASGHESKLAICLTHFDEVKGDNLRGYEAKKDHVTGSFYNAVQAIGKSVGREAENALKRLIPDRLIFLSNIQAPLPEKARFTRDQFCRLMEIFDSSILPPPEVHYRPVYDVANLILAVQKATQEFHDRWNGILGLGTRATVAPEHWTRVKALTRHVGLLKRDEYDTLRPIADLIRLIQTQVSVFLSEPLKWEPAMPPEDKEDEKIQALDNIKKNVFQRLHELSHRRLIDERLSGWVEAYNHRGTGSTRVRAREVVGLYESAAPVPNEMPGPDANEFLFELRELVADSVIEGGGELRGWSRDPSPV
jgi:hypothetical protein